MLEEADSMREPLAEEELACAGDAEEGLAEGAAEDQDVTAAELAVENVPAADAEENEIDAEEGERTDESSE